MCFPSCWIEANVVEKTIVARDVTHRVHTGYLVRVDIDLNKFWAFWQYHWLAKGWRSSIYDIEMAIGADTL